MNYDIDLTSVSGDESTVSITTIQGTDTVSPTPINENFNNLKNYSENLNSSIQTMQSEVSASMNLAAQANSMAETAYNSTLTKVSGSVHLLTKTFTSADLEAESNWDNMVTIKVASRQIILPSEYTPDNTIVIGAMFKDGDTDIGLGGYWCQDLKVFNGKMNGNTPVLGINNIGLRSGASGGYYLDLIWHAYGLPEDFGNIYFKILLFKISE